MEGGKRKSSLTSQTEPLDNPHFQFSTPMHQHQSHEMVALKKAYADVILNTVKEAAGRVMASERRAVMFQQELSSVKEEALRMLLHLKQMMDAKTTEAEKTSLEKQRKIDELEAQLNEAEDVITDLRVELKHVYLELEKTKNNQVQPLNGQNVKQVASFQECAKPKILVSSPNKELECVTSSNVMNKLLTVNGLDNECCNSEKQTEQLGISNVEDYYGHDSDLASINMRSKEPELRRNGFTQRIRALEGNLLDEKLLMQDADNQHCGKKPGLIAKDSNGEVAKFSALAEKMEIKKNIKHQSVQALNKFEHVEKAIGMDTKLLNLEGSAAQNLTGPSSPMKVEVFYVPSANTDFKDAKDFEENDGSSSQVDDSRLLKYTFQRKRKKESLRNADQNIDSEKSMVKKRRVEDKQNSSLEPQKSSIIEETSKDN
uniref:Uncharacterized protein n=1 Tax=Cajanus cajan TaxID=3821 RepID=A0A151SEC7_CAJCA|nr:hypothetical protein KK1_024911 [Cajanus cajan]